MSHLSYRFFFRVLCPAHKAVIDSLTSGPVSDHVYKLLVHLRSLPLAQGVHNAALTSLGFLFRAFPQLMLQPASTAIMDAAFTSGSSQTQLQLLRIIQDFLSCQNRTKEDGHRERPHAGVDIDELVGNVDGFADSG